MKWQHVLATLGMATAVSYSSFADQLHYKDILIGERAAGLGGAYIAISDDPSGIYFNPAGTVFSLENYFSLSANAFWSSSQKFKNIVSNQDYTYTSQNLLPTFFGFIQSWGRNKVGFTIVVPNADLLDQDDTITDLSNNDGEVNTLRRRFFRQDNTYLIGGSFAREIFENFTVGVSSFFIWRSDKAIDHQFIIYNPIGTGNYFSQNTTLSRTYYGVMAKLGMQWMPLPKLALGLTVSKPFRITSNGSARVIKTRLGSDNRPVPHDGTFDNDIEVTETTNLFSSIPEPIEIGFGTAWFVTKKFMAAVDLQFYTPDSNFREWSLQPVLNWSVGAEYYLGDSFAVRTGAFSNNTNTPSINTAATDQEVNVSLIGGSLGLSMFRPGSSFSLGGTYSFGSGKGQAIGGSTAVQDVEQNGYSIYFAGSYSL